MSDYKYSNKMFIERASDLIFNSGKTQTELVEILGLSNGSIANLKNKKVQTPSAETVCVLANYFNVSTDWLLGLTDIRSTDKATKELCDTLGLSEQSIEVLQDETDIYAKKSIDWLINQHCTNGTERFEIVTETIKENRMVASTLKGYDLVPFLYENSILYCLSNLIDLAEKPTCDIQFTMTDKGTLNVALFNATECTKEIAIENANTEKATNYNLDNAPEYIKNQIPNKLTLLPRDSFSYKEFVLHKHKQNINNVLTKFINETIHKQKEENLGLMNIKILSELYNNKTEDNNGNNNET